MRPGDDFYRYVSGSWLDSYKLKPDEMQYGAYIELVYRSEEQVKAIVDKFGVSSAIAGSDEQKIADFVASYLDASWAQLWCNVTREELATRLLKIDPHSPGKFRVNGIVRNLDAWYNAFSVTEDAALYLEPRERIVIW